MFQKFSGTVSILTLAVLSMQRYLTIVNPDRFKVTSYNSAFLIIAGIWIYTFFIAVPPFFGFGAYVPESSGMTFFKIHIFQNSHFSKFKIFKIQDFQNSLFLSSFISKFKFLKNSHFLKFTCFKM